MYQSVKEISRSALKNGRIVPESSSCSLAPGSKAEYGTYSNALRRSMTFGERTVVD